MPWRKARDYEQCACAGCRAKAWPIAVPRLTEDFVGIQKSTRSLRHTKAHRQHWLCYLNESARNCRSLRITNDGVFLRNVRRIFLEIRRQHGRALQRHAQRVARLHSLYGFQYPELRDASDAGIAVPAALAATWKLASLFGVNQRDDPVNHGAGIANAVSFVGAVGHGFGLQQHHAGAFGAHF